MMCLGWSTQQSCATRGAVQVTDPDCCPDITWFWVAAGTLVLGLLHGKKKQEGTA